MTINRKLATVFLTLGLLVPAVPAAAGDEPIDTTKEPATDSEGVGGKENAGETETAETNTDTSETGQKQVHAKTWGNWYQLMNADPWRDDVLPPRDGGGGSGVPDADDKPKDVEGCIEALQNYKTAQQKKPSADHKQTEIRTNCAPA